MTLLDGLAVGLVGLLLIADVTFTVRIIRATALMSAEASGRYRALSEESRRACNIFLSLNGYGTHGLHIVYVTSEVVIAMVLLTTGQGFFNHVISVAVLFVLIGSTVLHWHEARAADDLLESFFRQDLGLIDDAFSLKVLEDKREGR